MPQRSPRRRLYPMQLPGNRRNHTWRYSQRQSRPNQEGWRQVLGGLSSLLVLGGVLVYSSVNLAYTSFYGGLGIDPSDVGIGYATALSHAAGLIFLPLLFLTLSLLFIVILFPLMRSSSSVDLLFGIAKLTPRPTNRSGTRPDRLMRWLEQNRRRWPTIVAVSAVLLLVAFSNYWILNADNLAAAVQKGEPITRQGRLTNSVFAIRADPVAVLPSGKAGEAPQVEQLTSFAQ